MDSYASLKARESYHGAVQGRWGFMNRPVRSIFDHPNLPLPASPPFPYYGKGGEEKEGWDGMAICGRSINGLGI
jgi:hypothetical protein